MQNQDNNIVCIGYFLLVLISIHLLFPIIENLNVIFVEIRKNQPYLLFRRSAKNEKSKILSFLFETDFMKTSFFLLLQVNSPKCAILYQNSKYVSKSALMFTDIFNVLNINVLPTFYLPRDHTQFQSCFCLTLFIEIQFRQAFLKTLFLRKFQKIKKFFW